MIIRGHLTERSNIVAMILSVTVLHFTPFSSSLEPLSFLVYSNFVLLFFNAPIFLLHSIVFPFKVFFSVFLSNTSKSGNLS